jgi:hypothetical protein
VIKFVSDLRQVHGFPLRTPVSSTNKTDCHDITEILLKVPLNTIIHPPSSLPYFFPSKTHNQGRKKKISWWINLL